MCSPACMRAGAYGQAADPDARSEWCRRKLPLWAEITAITLGTLLLTTLCSCLLVLGIQQEQAACLSTSLSDADICLY